MASTVSSGRAAAVAIDGRPVVDGWPDVSPAAARNPQPSFVASSQGRLFIGAKAQHLFPGEVRALDLLTTVFTERGICNDETFTRETV